MRQRCEKRVLYFHIILYVASRQSPKVFQHLEVHHLAVVRAPEVGTALLQCTLPYEDAVDAELTVLDYDCKTFDATACSSITAACPSEASEGALHLAQESSCDLCDKVRPGQPTKGTRLGLRHSAVIILLQEKHSFPIFPLQTQHSPESRGMCFLRIHTVAALGA